MPEREIEIEIQKEEEMLVSMQTQLVAKRFKFANSKFVAIERRSFGCGKYGRFHDERCRYFVCRRCGKEEISTWIADRVCKFVLIATGRATSELIIPSLFFVKCITRHL